MNWMDFVVIGIVIGYALIGYARGLVYSAFKIASFFIAAFAAMKFYPYISKLLISPMHLDVILKEAFSKNMMNAVGTGQIGQSAGTLAANNLIGSWNLPQPVQDVIVKNLSVQANQVAGNLVDSLSSGFSVIAVNIISIIIIFIVVSFALIFVRSILEGIAKLPILNQVNRAGGLAFGLLQGVLIIYIGFAVLTLFASSQDLRGVFAAIDSSVLANNLYNHNVILIWAFGGKLF